MVVGVVYVVVRAAMREGRLAVQRTLDTLYQLKTRKGGVLWFEGVTRSTSSTIPLASTPVHWGFCERNVRSTGRKDTGRSSCSSSPC